MTFVEVVLVCGVVAVPVVAGVMLWRRSRDRQQPLGASMPAPPEGGLPASESSRREMERLLRAIQGAQDDGPGAIRLDRAKRRRAVPACVIPIGLEWAVAAVAGSRIDGAAWAMWVVIPCALATIMLWMSAIGFVPDDAANFSAPGYSPKLRGRADACACTAIIAAILTGGFGYLAAHASALERLPATRVTGQIDECDTKGHCRGTWWVDGRTYSDRVPFTPYPNPPSDTRRQPGDPVVFDVLTERPDVIVTRTHPRRDHGTVWFAAAVTVLLSVLWIALSAFASAPLRRRLREDAGW